MSRTIPTAPPRETEAAIARLRAHIEEFIALELTNKLNVQLASLVHYSVLDLGTGMGQIWSCRAP